MASVSDRIMRRVRAKGMHWVGTPKDFLDLGSRAAVHKALARLWKRGLLRRPARGLYHRPRYSKILKRGEGAVCIVNAIDAVVRRDGIKIMPKGIVAANALHLTTAVPARLDYYTDGRSREIKISNRTVTFEHAGPDIMWWYGRPSARVMLALLWIGPMCIDDPILVPRLRRYLPDFVKKDLARNIDRLPEWAIPVARGAIAQ